MNPEIIAGATFVGYAAGQLAEQHALSVIAKNRPPAIEASVGAQPDERGRLLSRLVTPLALVGAVACYSLALGFEPNDGGNTETTALVATVVDHDSISGTDGVANLENVIATSFYNGDNHVTNHFITAHNGTSDPVSISELAKDIADGPASVEPTVTSSLSVGFANAVSSQTNLLKDVKAKSGAEVVMIDQYDVLPDAATIQADAEKAGNLPVYILDISGSGKPPVNRANISQIATTTGGKYWTVSPENYKSVISAMESDIKPHNSIHQPGGDTLPYKIIGLALTGLGAYMYTRRKSETAVS